MTKFVSVDQFRKEARSKRKPTGGVYRLTAEPSIEVEGADRTRRFCFSDGSVDRMGDTIDPTGWDIDDFLANPVALWAHDSSAPPIGRASNVGPVGPRLMGDIEFAAPETYDFADLIFRLLTGGFLRAVSVGFMPIEYSFVENDPDRGWGIDFKRQSLLEISVCPVPANPNALGEARAKGIDTRPLVEWAERTLDGGGKVIMPRAELERLRKAAKEPTMPKPRLRAGGASEDDPTSGGAVIGNCGRDKDDSCGMKDPEECSVHGGGKSVDNPDDDDAKAIKRLRRLIRLELRGDEGNPSDDEPPLAHEDAIRMAHKCLRTAKAFHAEAMGHFSKGMDHLDGVVDALNKDATDGDPETDPPDDPDPDGETKRRAAALARKRTLSIHLT